VQATTASYRLIVILDIVKSGERTDPEQTWLRENLYRITERALGAAGIEPAGKEDRGDGILLLLPGNVSKPRLLGLFTDAIEAGLRSHAQQHRGTPRELRLRLALHAGEVARDSRGWVGSDLNAAFRMVDLPEMRNTLRAAPKAVLAVGVSDILHRAVIRHGYPGIDPQEYAPVRFSAKELRDETLWVRVPGYYEPPGLAGEATAGTDTPASGSAAAQGTAADPDPSAPAAAPTVGIGQVHGGISHGGIGVSQGDVRQTFGTADAGPSAEYSELRAELERLRADLKEALLRKEIDDGTYQDATEELDEAERHSRPQDEEGRGRLLRALKRLRGLVEDVGGLASAVAALIRSVREAR
jgi:hypothetical protein